MRYKTDPILRVDDLADGVRIVVTDPADLKNRLKPDSTCQEISVQSILTNRDTNNLT